MLVTLLQPLIQDYLPSRLKSDWKIFLQSQACSLWLQMMSPNPDGSFWIRDSLTHKRRLCQQISLMMCARASDQSLTTSTYAFCVPIISNVAQGSIVGNVCEKQIQMKAETMLMPSAAANANFFQSGIVSSRVDSCEMAPYGDILLQLPTFVLLTGKLQHFFLMKCLAQTFLSPPLA